MDTHKSNRPKIGFVSIESIVTEQAIRLEAKLMFRQIKSLRKLFISTPNKTMEFNK